MFDAAVADPVAVARVGIFLVRVRIVAAAVLVAVLAVAAVIPRRWPLATVVVAVSPIF